MLQHISCETGLRPSRIIPLGDMRACCAQVQGRTSYLFFFFLAAAFNNQTYERPKQKYNRCLRLYLEANQIDDSAERKVARFLINRYICTKFVSTRPRLKLVESLVRKICQIMNWSGSGRKKKRLVDRISIYIEDVRRWTLLWEGLRKLINLDRGFFFLYAHGLRRWWLHWSYKWTKDGNAVAYTLWENHQPLIKFRFSHTTVQP